MTPRQERSIIRKALAGDRQAAEALVRAHQGSLYAYMLRISGRPEVAEDVVQEAFFRALTHLARYDQRFRFSTWLFTIAKRLHVNACQRLAPSFDTDTVGLAPGKSATAESFWQSDESAGARREAIDYALDRLTVDQREAVVLFYQLDWSVEQIGEYLDQPEGTVKSHLHRARRKMRELLEARAENEPALREVMR